MKARTRILDVRRQSRITSTSENLWFVSDDRTEEQSNAAKRQSVRNDRSSILRDDYDRYSLSNLGRDNKKKECPFIVDWQMSDAF